MLCFFLLHKHCRAISLHCTLCFNVCANCIFRIIFLLKFAIYKYEPRTNNTIATFAAAQKENVNQVNTKQSIAWHTLKRQMCNDFNIKD